MRTDRGGVWWSDGTSTTLPDSLAQRENRLPPNIERRNRDLRR
jgi:hypothetical protein